MKKIFATWTLNGQPETYSISPRPYPVVTSIRYFNRSPIQCRIRSPIKKSGSGRYQTSHRLFNKPVLAFCNCNHTVFRHNPLCNGGSKRFHPWRSFSNNRPMWSWTWSTNSIGNTSATPTVDMIMDRYWCKSKVLCLTPRKHHTRLIWLI